MQLNRTGEKILLTLWVGGHWLIGFAVVPLLRNALADEAYAEVRSSILQQLFGLMNVVAIGAAVLLLLLTTLRLGWQHWRNMLIAGVIVVTIASFWVQNKMQTLAAGSEEFASLHGGSMVLYLAMGVLGLALVAFQDNPRALLSDNDKL